MSETLYSTPILRLAASQSHVGLIEDAPVQVQKTSRICGSRLTITAAFDHDGRIKDFGQDVKACALGQASASLMSARAVGLDADTFAAADTAMQAMLAGEDYSFPAGFEDFGLLAPVAEHRARRGSVMLPFDCLRDAFKQA